MPWDKTLNWRFPSAERETREGVAAPGQRHGNRRSGALVALGQGVVLLDQGLQAFAQHMGIDLGGGDIGVPQHLLHRPEIGAVVQQVTGESLSHKPLIAYLNRKLAPLYGLS